MEHSKDERAEGFWWVRFTEDEDGWETARVDGPAPGRPKQTVVPSPDTAFDVLRYDMDDVVKWGPYLGKSPDDMKRRLAPNGRDYIRTLPDPMANGAREGDEFWPRVKVPDRSMAEQDMDKMREAFESAEPKEAE